MRKILLVLFMFVLSTSFFKCESCKKESNDENNNIVDDNSGEDKPSELNEIISEVRFSLDSQEYIVTSDSNQYEATYIKDKDYLYLIVEVDAKEGYSFNENTKVYINDNLQEDHLTLSDNHKKITYKIKDPNWTPTY